jgi:hypothetical protein
LFVQEAGQAGKEEGNRRKKESVSITLHWRQRQGPNSMAINALCHRKQLSRSVGRGPWEKTTLQGLVEGDIRKIDFCQAGDFIWCQRQHRESGHLTEHHLALRSKCLVMRRLNIQDMNSTVAFVLSY